jgi:serine/threonine protein kinase
MIGTSLNQYRITASIGVGGMGEVFRARDTRLNRDLAVKVLPKDFVADADRLRRFEQEARTLAVLNHPNVLTVFDAGMHEGAPYLVSELLEGQTLREGMKSGALAARKATDFALQLAHGLAAAHSKGVIHRDLKPENTFITKDGRVKILDFGLAKLKVGTTCRSSETDAQQRVPPPPTLTPRLSSSRPSNPLSLAWFSARRLTCHRSRCAVNRRIIARTSSPSAVCSTKCSVARGHFGAAHRLRA